MRIRVSRRTFLILAAGGKSLAGAAMVSNRQQHEAIAATPPAGNATPGAGDIEHPGGADKVVLRIEYVGGFLPPQARLTELPLVSLYGDGRLVTQGPQIAIFPPPALPNLRQMYLTEEGIQLVLAAADEAGLIGRDRRYENPIVADAPYTLVTINAAGGTTRVAAYALGTDNPEATPEQREELAQLQRFVGQFTDVTSWLPASAIASVDEEYPIERLQVTAEPYDPATADPSVGEQQPIDWPLATPISAFAPAPDLPGTPDTFVCGVVTGAEAEDLVAAAREANALTPWASEGEQYQASFRPLLPDETGCPPRQDGLELLPEPEATPAA